MDTMKNGLLLFRACFDFTLAQFCPGQITFTTFTTNRQANRLP